MKKLQLFKEVQKLHLEHGDYVRIGPSELSISDPQAVQAIYGSQAPVTKEPWYTLLEPRVPLFMACDKREHAHRRKVWDQAFTTKALQGYDPRITKTINLLLTAIEKHDGKPMDMSKWFAYFASDVMEYRALNKSSNMLRDGKLIVIAGSESTAATLTHIFLHLSHDRQLISAMQ
ncbi:hypothetical protein S40293_02236 [Stachybotrys chartarum IBT 40293]|nr:hypothetical protein S40293_02236 [Stachybotrys chartarum IBT 40293]KFA71256.1 hypothetical protein S40288_07808 [Stachybotrys chartarum IBT 40288]